MKYFKRIGIDVGTSNSLVWMEGNGVVLSEPTLVAVSAEERKIIAVGREAEEMVGKTPDHIEIIRPLQDGVIDDYEITEALVRTFIRRVMGNNWFIGPEVMVCIPSGVTQVEQRAILDATLGAGARKAYMIDKPLAAAIGAKIAISECFGNMIVDIGGGNTEVAIIALGGVVTHNSGRIGGIKIDKAIVDYMKREFGIIVGEKTAENIKIKLGSAIKLKKAEVLSVSGRDFITGLPKVLDVDSDSIHEALKPILENIVEVIRKTLEITPPELLSDIMDRGIILSGGGSQLRNLNVFITREIGVSTHLAVEPQLCVIKGTGLVIENFETYKRALR